MSKVGRFIIDPRAGTYCHVRLDRGDKVLVSHETGREGTGRLAVEISKWLGLGSERVCVLDLDTVEGRASFLRVTAAVSPSAQATPLQALVEYVKDAKDPEDLRQRCDALFPAARVA